MPSWWTIKHWDSYTRFYEIYRWMLKRCNNKNHMHYKSYWWRGIKCLWSKYEDFKKDMYESYLEHCKEYWEKNTTIDRINVDGNYCKENCRWATYSEQWYNKRFTEEEKKHIHYVTVNWKEIPLPQYCRENNLNYTTLKRRIDSWWDMKEVINKDVSTTVEYHWKKYRSILDLCKNLWINHRKLYKLLWKWLILEDAIRNIKPSNHYYVNWVTLRKYCIANWINYKATVKLIENWKDIWIKYTTIVK